MENTPKTFKELFANTGIEPTTDENGNTHYHFNAIRKKEHKEEPSEFEITPEFTYGKEVGKTIKIKATINSIETEQETLEEVVKVKRTELFNTILSIVKQIPRKDIDYDAMDAPSCAYEIEQLFYKLQQEQEKNKYNDEDLRTAYFSGIKTTGEGWNGEYANGNNPSIEEEFQEEFQEWLRQFKNK
jgi:hypothetical protein